MVSFQSTQARSCCSVACELLHRRRIDLDAYHRRTATDPTYNQRRYQACLRRAQMDADLASRMLEQRRQAHERRRQRILTDPVVRAHVQAQARAYYARDAAQVQQRRRARLQQMLAAMSDDELEFWRARRRAQWRSTANRSRSAPDRRSAYREYMRAYRRERALRDLFAIGNQLIERNNNDQ